MGANAINLELPVSIAQGGTGQATQQAALDAITAVSEASTAQVLTKDESGNATFQDPAGGDNHDKVLNFLSSLTAGDIAGIINDGGTLKVKSFDDMDKLFEYGTAQIFESADTRYTSCAKIDTGKFVICYQDYGNSMYGTSIIATVSGTVITFGTAVVFESANTSHISCAKIDTDKFVVCYRDTGNSDYGTSIIATVSGTVPTFGTAVVFESASTEDISCAKIDTGKFVVCYRDAGNSNYGTSIVATVSGTVPTFGTAVVFESATVYHVSCAKINTNKFVVCYQDAGNSSFGTSIIATVSGTVPTFGTAVVFESANTSYISCALIDTDKFVVCYKDYGNSSYGTSIISEGILDEDYTPVIVKTTTAAESDGTVTLRGGIATAPSGSIAAADIGKLVYQDASNEVSLVSGDIIGEVTGVDEFSYVGKNIYV